MFLEDVNIEKALIANKNSSLKKSYKYFIGYFYNDYKVKQLHKMPLKTRVYVKSYEGQITITNYWKNIILPGIKTGLI